VEEGVGRVEKKKGEKRGTVRGEAGGVGAELGKSVLTMHGKRQGEGKKKNEVLDANWGGRTERNRDTYQEETYN